MVGIIGDGQKKVKDFVNCDENGNYKIKLHTAGNNNLLYSIPGHKPVKIPIINKKEEEITIDISLVPYKYKDSFDDVAIAGTFNNFDIRNPDKMTKLENGTYKYEIETDKKEIKYQLCNITESRRTINSPNSMIYSPDSTGDYYSIINVKNGKVTIKFNPKELLIKDAEPVISITGSEVNKKIITSTREYKKQYSEALSKMFEFRKANKKGGDFHFDGGEYLPNLMEKINTEKDSFVKDYLKLIYVSFSMFKPKNYEFSKASDYFESIAPNNNIWNYLPEAFRSLYSLVPNYKWTELQDKFLEESSSKAIKTNILTGRLSQAKYKGNTEEYKKIRNRLKNEFGDVELVKQILKTYPLESKIKVGAAIPDFEIASLDNTDEKFTKKNMLGKIYMIDFWATWCMPCVMEMKSLHKAYDKFKDKGFEILSISSDMNAETVAKFRKERWAMPWKNSLIKGEKDKKIQTDFEVTGIPKPILVSADGKILAMQGDLRGENLEKTLSKYFK